ncbi:hypothetical protein [Hymenobacter sp. GOD-10R]|uniref:hypothetical protein n=1 Tax=Hymenobacter sp. GOD-10R TaxID=3093922 RepID=UPI002D767B45|nr:hypothetical protein [Hymenobacter sp. GOD-10R]WRQ27969.1 hypothetical protein SD425_23125 [Hymenobacter sp. GOD-10R]
MRKSFCLLLVLVLFGTTLLAQSTNASLPAAPPTASADSGAVLLFNGWYLPRYQPKAAEADTTGALLSMFRRRRVAGYAFTIPFIVGMSLALPISSTDSYGRTTVASEAISPPLGIAVLAGTFAGFIVHANTYNKKHLLAVDHAYAAGKPIPAKYRRGLKQQHFAEAAYLREALRQQMQREQLQTSNTSK